MKIEHQTPYPDLTYQVQAPLGLVAENGRRYDLTAWALSGFSTQGWDQVPAHAELIIPFQGVEVGFPVRLRHDANQNFAFFEGLTGRQRETLALFYRNLLSGQMATVGDVITSLDTPVDLVPMGETEEEAKVGAQSQTRRGLRFAAHLMMYVALAYLVFGVLGGALWARIDRVPLEHGRIAAPDVTLSAIDTGKIYHVAVQPGDRVTAGDTLVKIRNARRDAEADTADTSVLTARADLADVRAALAELRDLDVRGAGTALRLAVAARLHARFFRTAEFEAAQVQWMQMRETAPDLAAAIDPVALTRTRLEELARLRARALGAAKEVAKSRGRAARDLHLVAPADGTIGAVWAVSGTPVRSGTALVQIETDGTRQAVAFADQGLADVLYVGMPTAMSFNFGGDIIEIEGTITDLTAGADPKRPGAYGIIVTVTPTRADPRLAAGAPVRLIARKNIAARAFARLTGRGA
ncbi:MAG: HlyD family efflux transporter periplasmic adaptor subunit [Pseudomonadota bacterium]